ncbi:MAG: hypothetical protein ABSG40_18520, partial [Terriglobales bacterium]
LGNPAKYAGFPLFHRLGYGRLTKPDISLATKTGHFNLLTTAGILQSRYVSVEALGMNRDIEQMSLRLLKGQRVAHWLRRKQRLVTSVTH